ncbi:hypothetical protein Tco_1437200 [Tanacetum coccineum]
MNPISTMDENVYNMQSYSTPVLHQVPVVHQQSRAAFPQCDSCLADHHFFLDGRVIVQNVQGLRVSDDPTPYGVLTKRMVGWIVVNTLALPLETEVKGSILTPCKAGGPFIPLVKPEAASLGVWLSTSQPPPYTVEDGVSGARDLVGARDSKVNYADHATWLFTPNDIGHTSHCHVKHAEEGYNYHRPIHEGKKEYLEEGHQNRYNAGLRSPGTYSEIAALRAYPMCKTVPYDQGIIIPQVVELWLHIVGEVELVVNHHLLGLPGFNEFGYKDVTILQALEQCEIMLDKLGVVKASTVVTAGAAQVKYRTPSSRSLLDVQLMTWFTT